MAMPHSSKQTSPDRDASLGLIFRLNNLWAQVDVPASNGDYKKWNSILDRIYCNLLYENEIEIIKDEKTNEIKNIKLNDEDEKEYTFLSKKVFFWKTKWGSVGNQRNKNGIPLKMLAWNNWYHALQLKDIWLRKLMQRLGLYMKVIEHRPGTAFFGGAS